MTIDKKVREFFIDGAYLNRLNSNGNIYHALKKDLSELPDGSAIHLADYSGLVGKGYSYSDVRSAVCVITAEILKTTGKRYSIVPHGSYNAEMVRSILGNGNFVNSHGRYTLKKVA